MVLILIKFYFIFFEFIFYKFQILFLLLYFNESPHSVKCFVLPILFLPGFLDHSNTSHFGTLTLCHMQLWFDVQQLCQRGWTLYCLFDDLRYVFYQLSESMLGKLYFFYRNHCHCLLLSSLFFARSQLNCSG